MEWRRVGTDPATGNEIHQKTIEFENTGNNEGTMADAIEVRTASGTVLASTEMHLDWEYHATIDAEFVDGGHAVQITGQCGPDRTVKRLQLPTP